MKKPVRFWRDRLSLVLGTFWTTNPDFVPVAGSSGFAPEIRRQRVVQFLSVFVASGAVLPPGPSLLCWVQPSLFGASVPLSRCVIDQLWILQKDKKLASLVAYRLDIYQMTVLRMVKRAI